MTLLGKRLAKVRIRTQCPSSAAKLGRDEAQEVTKRSAFCRAIPRDELAQTFFKTDLWLVAEQAMSLGNIGPCQRHVARLHGLLHADGFATDSLLQHFEKAAERNRT